MHKKEELISLLLKLKIYLHQHEQNIHELIELINGLSLKREDKKINYDSEKIEICGRFVSLDTKRFIPPIQNPETRLIFLTVDYPYEGLPPYQDVKLTIEPLLGVEDNILKSEHNKEEKKHGL